MKIGLLGYGSLGKQIHFLLKEINHIDDHQITIFDDVYTASDSDKFTVKSFQSVFEKEFKDYPLYICLGYHHLTTKQKLIDELITKGYTLPNLIHPAANISIYSVLGHANIFFSGAIVDLFSVIGDGNVFYNNTCITHDVKINNCNFFGPSVTVCGNTVIGNANFIGARTAISNNLKIGNENKIGIGSVISKNIDSNISGVGFPFRAIYKDLDIN